MKEYRDHYFLKAKQENYPARSVYKLKEIDGRFKIFRKHKIVRDTVQMQEKNEEEL